MNRPIKVDNQSEAAWNKTIYDAAELFEQLLSPEVDIVWNLQGSYHLLLLGGVDSAVIQSHSAVIQSCGAVTWSLLHSHVALLCVYVAMRISVTTSAVTDPKFDIKHPNDSRTMNTIVDAHNRAVMARL